MPSLLSLEDVEDIRDEIAPAYGDDLVDIGEVWRKPTVAAGTVPGGAGVGPYGGVVNAGSNVSRPDQTFAKIAEYPLRITRAGFGNETQFGGQTVAIAPWTLSINAGLNPDVTAADKVLIAKVVRMPDGNMARAVWSSGEAVQEGDIRQPVASNGRFYRATVGGVTGVAEPAWPIATKGATVVDGGVTWQYVDKLRTFEVKDGGDLSTVNIMRLVRCEEVKQ